MTGPERKELDLFGLPAPVEPTRSEQAAVEQEPEAPTLQPGQHVEKALAAELEPDEEAADPEVVEVGKADAVGQTAMFDLAELTHDPFAEVKRRWDSAEAVTPEARLEVFRSVTIKAMKLGYKLGEYETVIEKFERVCKKLNVRTPSEAVPLLLDYFERGQNGHAH